MRPEVLTIYGHPLTRLIRGTHYLIIRCATPLNVGRLYNPASYIGPLGLEAYRIRMLLAHLILLASVLIYTDLIGHIQRKDPYIAMNLASAFAFSR